MCRGQPNRIGEGIVQSKHSVRRATTWQYHCGIAVTLCNVAIVCNWVLANWLFRVMPTTSIERSVTREVELSMTQEEWATSNNARKMLGVLHKEQPLYLRTQTRQLHRFLIACCWRHQHLIPQEGLRNGLKGAEKWLAGEIGYRELNELNYFAEAEAFKIDYARSPEELDGIKILIESIAELRDLPFKLARKRLLKAAYFAEGSMIYPMLRPRPWNSLLESEFLCADLLRDHIEPNFGPRTWMRQAKERISYFVSVLGGR